MIIPPIIGPIRGSGVAIGLYMYETNKLCNSSLHNNGYCIVVHAIVALALDT